MRDVCTEMSVPAVGLGVNFAVKQYPNPAGDPVPCGLRSPPDDVIIPLFPEFLKARENAVKFTQAKFLLFSPDSSRFLIFSYMVTMLWEPVYHNIKCTYLL